MNQKVWRSWVMAVIIASLFILAGCGGTEQEPEVTDTEQEPEVTDTEFAPDLTDTEWLGYRVSADGDYIASAEYTFTQDRIIYLTQDVNYTLHTGEEAYTEAMITEKEGEALYSEDSFDGDERGGFLTIIMHYDNGKGGLYGWMNKSMDKMELTDPYDKGVCYLFKKDTDAVAAYEEKVEPYFNLFMKDYLKSEEGVEITYADRVLEFANHMEVTNNASEKEAKSDMVIDAIAKDFDNDVAKSAELAGKLESMLYLDGTKVKLSFTYKDELIACAIFDKSGEIKEERFLYGR